MFSVIVGGRECANEQAKESFFKLFKLFIILQHEQGKNPLSPKHIITSASNPVVEGI